MKTALFTLLLLLTPFIATATPDNPQTPNVKVANQSPRKNSDANIFGHVISANTGEHLPFATITIKDTTIGCAANGTGHYSINNIPVGEHTIVVSAIGYETKELNYIAIARTTEELNFSLVETTTMVDEVVVSATRNETNRRQTATVVNVASTKLFEGTASSNLSEAMNFQSGLRVENTCGNCGAPQLRINGLEGQYSQILLDSRAIFSSLAGVYGLDLMPVAMVERVEVIRGGGSALFGSSAIGGVVNIITKDPVRNTLSLSNTTNIMEDGTPDINTSLGGAFVSDDYKLGTYIFGQVKNRGGYDRNDDGFTDITALRSETAGFRGYYKTSAHSRLSAEYHHIHDFRRGGDNLDGAPHMSYICEQIDHNIDGGSLKFDYFPNMRHRASIYTSAQGISRATYFGADMNPDAYGTTKDMTFVAGGQYTHNYKAGLPAELTAGVEYNYNSLNDYYVATQRRLDQQTSTIGLFAQNEWKSEKVNFLIGFRLDKHNMIDRPIFAPRANVRYSPIEDLGLRLSYSSGYRAPQAYNEDLHIDALNHSVSIIEIDPNLRPEFSHSLSASADYYHNFGRLQTNFLVEGFYTKLNNVFALRKLSGTDAQGNIVQERHNAYGAHVYGMNLEARASLTKWFQLQAGFTLQRSQYDREIVWNEDVPDQKTKRILRSPDAYGYFTASLTPIRNLTVALTGNYTGSMHIGHNAGSGTPVPEIVETPAFMTLNAKVTYEIPIVDTFRMQVSGGVQNIANAYQNDFDQGWERDSDYMYGPSTPRSYHLGVKLIY